MESIEGLKVVICGGTGGVGSAAVRGFSDDGARVAALYRRTPPPDDLAGKAHWIRCDVTDRVSVDAAFDDAAATLGGIDVLIQASGTSRGGAPETVTEADFTFLFAQNVLATMLTNQAAYRWMREAGGRIVNFGSSEGVSGNPHAPLYAATRGAVHSWTRSVARAWGGSGITVNSVAPAMHTPLAERTLSEKGAEGRVAFEAALAGRIPIGGRLGEPLRDLYPMLRLLAGPGGQFVTGQLIPVDGGLIMVGA